MPRLPSVCSDPKYGAEMLRVEWAADQQIAAGRDHRAGAGAGPRRLAPGQGNAAPLSDAERKLNLAATELLPTDGLVKRDRDRTSSRGKHDDVAKARAIYEWVVENSARNPKTQRLRSGRHRVVC